MAQEEVGDVVTLPPEDPEPLPIAAYRRRPPRQPGDLGPLRAPLGTPAYMSPEQARGDVHLIDRRSDVYSLGATLYELLTGRPPFVEASFAAVLLQAIHDDPPAPRSLVPSVPIDLETIALQCLAKDPAQRYPSARALVEDHVSRIRYAPEPVK